MSRRDVGFVLFVVAAIGALAAAAIPQRVRGLAPSVKSSAQTLQGDAIADVVGRIDRAFDASWRARGLEPAPPAADLAVMRRASLALTGTIPSLEEIRRFEASPAANRVELWVDTLLGDRRTSDYLAERFARAFVGTEDGPFVLFRRRRLTEWLGAAIRANRRYDEIARALIAEGGLWTDHPATNFVTVTFDQQKGRPDPERLAARVSRAFLGVRLDCAQCHDHPFQSWKQSDFRGLAAFFGGVHSDLRGVREEASDYEPLDPKSHSPAKQDACVPFRDDLLPVPGSDRARLASWVTDRNNHNFSAATVNRMWALVYGRPLCDPIDDLPPDADQPEALKIAAADFAAHGYDLHRLIRVLTRCRTFRLDSTTPNDATATAEDLAWSTFPLTRLRPDQIAGALNQTAYLSTISADSFWFVRLIALTSRNDFVRRYGDVGEDEFEDRNGTISQRLLLLNGELVESAVQDGLFNAVSRVAAQAPDAPRAVEIAYLVVLTRPPTDAERGYFARKIGDLKGDARAEAVSDLFWTLINSSEFSWNH